MGEGDGIRRRRIFCWPKEARDLVSKYQREAIHGRVRGASDRSVLVTRLAGISGNPRDACIRFLREFGVQQKRDYREWTKPEQQRLLDLISSLPVEEVAKILRRPVGSVRSMLHRLGMGARTGPRMVQQVLAVVRTAHPARGNPEMDRSRLAQSARLPLAGVKANIIDPDDFCRFVKEHTDTRRSADG